MKDSGLAMRVCVMVFSTMLIFRRWSMKARFVTVSDGEEENSMTEMVL